MSEKDTAHSEAPPKAAREKPRTYPIEALRRDCGALFSVTESTFDGATHGEQGEQTIESVREIIDKWRARPVLRR